jgi:serine protease AprX
MTAATRIEARRHSILVPILLLASLLIPPLGRATAVISPLHRASTAVDPDLLGIDQGQQRIIVQKFSTADRAPERAVARLGGTITRDLPIVHGFAATLDSSAVLELAKSQGIRAISHDAPVRFLDSINDGLDEPLNSKATAVERADKAWAAGLSGAGVTVAVIDTGIADVPDLSGRIVPVVNETGLVAPCINFSGEAGCQDSYGHGTFVAGVIAASGTGTKGQYKGVAPQARLVSVKLSGRDGAADVSALLAAIQWVVSYRSTYGIRVLNLSVGTDSAQSYRIDPLNYAVEQAWAAGITVVVAASNRGPNLATITKPADDPWVVTVGAMDDNGTVGETDDAIPDFSARGPTLGDALPKPDLVAPGAHIVSLRSPGSAIDGLFPHPIGKGYRRGSGTSFATPGVVGSVALMLQAHPDWSPDRIKYALTHTTVATASTNPLEVGSGLLNTYDAIYNAPAGTANQGLVLSTGLGSLDLSRGTLIVDTTDTLPVTLTGNTTQQLRLYDAAQYAGTTWSGASWHTSQWVGASWHGASWHGASWHGASWHGASWHGASWHTSDGGDPDRTYGIGYYGSALLGAWE